MRKYLFPALLVCLFLLLASQAQAMIEVHETAYSSATVTSVAVSTAAGEQVDVTSLTARFTAEIYNDDTSLDLYCSFNVNVSSLTASVYYGRKITPGAAWTVAVSSILEIYCISEASGTEPIAVVTQLR